MTNNKRKNLMMKIPIGVRIIGGWHYVGAVIILISGLISIFASTDSFLLQTLFVSNLEKLSRIIIGLVLIPFAVFYYYIGFKLRIGERWARTTVLTIAGIGLAYSLYSYISYQGWKSGTVINLIILGYLLFNKNAQSAFRKKK